MLGRFSPGLAALAALLSQGVVWRSGRAQRSAAVWVVEREQAVSVSPVDDAVSLQCPLHSRSIPVVRPALRRGRFADRGSYAEACMRRYKAPDRQQGTSRPERPHRRARNQTRPRGHVVSSLRQGSR